MLLWIVLSAAVIMANKYILDRDMGGFPYPLTLTCTHMAFCSLFAWLLVRLRFTEVQPMPFDTWSRWVHHSGPTRQLERAGVAYVPQTSLMQPQPGHALWPAGPGGQVQFWP